MLMVLVVSGYNFFYIVFIILSIPNRLTFMRYMLTDTAFSDAKTHAVFQVHLIHGGTTTLRIQGTGVTTNVP